MYSDPFANDLRHALDTGWPWPLEGVQEWFEDLWNYVGEVGEWVVTNVVGPVSQGIRDAVSGILSGVSGFLNDSFRGVVDTIKAIGDIAWSAGSWTASTVTKGVADLFSAASTSIGNAIGTGLGPLVGIGTGLAGISTFLQGLPQDVRDWLAKFFGRFMPHSPGILEDIIQYIIDMLQGKKYRAYMDARVETLGYDPSMQMRDLQKLWKPVSDMVEALFSPVFTQISDRAKIPIGSPPSTVVNDAVSTVKLMVSVMIPFIIAMIAGELVHPTKELGLSQASAALFDIAGFRRISWDIMGAFTYVTSVIPLERALYETIQPLVPREEEIMRLTSRGVLNREGMTDLMHKVGYSDYWASLYWATHWDMPRWADLQQMVWRRGITQDQMNEALRYLATSDPYMKGYESILWDIPRSTDLITFVVREVIPPERFYDAMELQGFQREWSEAYWEAHWRLPDFGNLQTAMWRGVISKEDYDHYLVLWDYKPEPRPGLAKADRTIMSEISYDLPGRIDMRWMARWGMVDLDVLKDLELKRGIHPDWADKIAESEWQNMLLDERSRVLSALRSMYGKGYISRADFQKEVLTLKFTPHETELTMRAADLDYAQERKEDRLKLATELFRRDQITKTEFVTELTGIGLQPDRAVSLADFTELKVKKVEMPDLTKDERTALKTALLSRFREGYMNKEDLTARLEGLGLSSDEISLTLERADTEYMLDYRSDLLTLLREQYEKGVISAEQMYSYLIQVGMQPERARTIVDLEVLRWTPRPKAGAA